MEVQAARFEVAADDGWSFAEWFVLVGWLFALLTFCTCLSVSCCYLGTWISPRKSKRERMMAGTTERRECSTQTILCTPPSTIGKDPHQRPDNRGTSPPSSRGQETVYSTYKMKGKEAILQDMVVRALPVVCNLDQRRRAASLREIS